MIKKILHNAWIVTLISVIVSAFIYVILAFIITMKDFQFGLIISIITPAIIAYPISVVLIRNQIKIEAQNLIIEKKNKEIIDSINYAKRIQSALLPSSQIIDDYLKKSFVFYKPKDIVAGDFYWLEPKLDKVLFAAADCTGHGVSGAMTSMVCINALNRTVREYNLTNPGEILDKTREIVIGEFEKSFEELQDGMDIALCSIEGNKLEYSGANNPLWIIRNNEIIETKATKQPIGNSYSTLPFTNHTIDLQKGDRIYIFSDGYRDQFGGEKGKKFKIKAFRELLLSIHSKPIDEQKTILNNTIEEWQRGEFEQTDDILLIGIEV